MIFYLAQLMMIAFSHFVGKKEAIYLLAVRKLPAGNDIEKPYHKWGWKAAAYMGISLTIMQLVSVPEIGIEPSLIGLCIMPFTSILLYWIFYELAFSKPVFGRTFFIGTTAEWDKRLWKWFGKNAERWVVGIKVAGVVLLNALYLILKNVL